MSGNWSASYRLQLHAGFPLSQAREVLPYLADLGISHVYLSPCLQAVPGSQHGYDVTDPRRISEDLGGESAWAAFVEGARSLGLRILLDIVPNHMSASEHNPWWDDVLTHGPFSQFADYFDLMNPPNHPFRVQLCSLARPYGAAIEAGELAIEVAKGRPRVRHHENSWPLGPASWGTLLAASEAPSASAASCFGELERLHADALPGAEHRSVYAKYAALAEKILAGAHSSGGLQDAVDHTRRDKDLLDAVLQLGRRAP